MSKSTDSAASLQPLPPHHLRAELALLGMTLLWGSTFTVTRLSLNALGVWQLLAVRFTIALVVTIAIWPKALRIRGHGRAWLGALWLGAWLSGGYLTQTIGLQTTSAPRSAFITSMTVIFVPIFDVLRTRQWPRRATFAGIAVSVAGLWFLCDPRGSGITSGDLWTLACAVMWSVYIVELGRLAHIVDLGRLLLGPCLLTAVACWGGSVATGSLTWDFGSNQWLMLAHLGLLCTFLTTLTQSRFQRDTTPTRAALIFCAEPVFASAIAWVSPLGEALTAWQALGAALILGGIALTEVLGEKRGG